MQISEFSFPHLNAAHEERLTVELERQRVAAERRADADGAAEPARRRGIRSERSSRRIAWLGVARGPVDPCPTCP